MNKTKKRRTILITMLLTGTMLFAQSFPDWIIGTKYENNEAKQGEVKWMTATKQSNVKTITLAIQGVIGDEYLYFTDELCDTITYTEDTLTFTGKPSLWLDENLKEVDNKETQTIDVMKTQKGGKESIAITVSNP